MAGGLVSREAEWPGLGSPALVRPAGSAVAAEVPSEWPEPVARNPALACLAGARSVLLLQGPVGPFFDRVSQWLLGRGTAVHRVVFSGGDEHDCRAVDPIRFSDEPALWPATCAQLLAALKPDCVVLFGQARHYHKVAIEHAKALDLPVVVMEEGYFRPGFVTMELGGVNGYSKTLDRYGWDFGPGDSPISAIPPDLAAMHFQKMAWHASQHYLALHRARPAYPDYLHHRNSDPAFYAVYWVRSWLRKLRHRRPDRRVQQWLFDTGAKYYFVPLQLEGDSQITHHSPFKNNGEFALRVLRSFAAHAPADTLVVFRQHPHARGGTPIRPVIECMARALGVSQRTRFLVEGDTPDLAERSRGTVVINSTTGLQAIERRSPLIALGEALYDRPRLTFQGELDAFWQAATPPDPEASLHFLAQVKNLTQVPASIYEVRQQPLLWSAFC